MARKVTLIQVWMLTGDQVATWNPACGLPMTDKLSSGPNGLTTVRMIHSVSSPTLQDGQINLLSDKRLPQAVNSLISAQQQELSNGTDTLIIVSPLFLTYLYVSFKFSRWLCPPPPPKSQSLETFKNDCNWFRQMACQIKNALSQLISLVIFRAVTSTIYRSHSGERQWDSLWDLATRKSVWAEGFVLPFCLRSSP